MAGDDVAALGFAIDSKPIRDATDDMKNMQSVAQLLSDAAGKLQDGLKSLSDQQNKSRQVTQQARQEMDRHSNSAHQAYNVFLGLRLLFRELQTAMHEWAGELGRVGAILLEMGPSGLIAAGAIGGIAIVLHELAESALQLANRVGDMKDFAETTGLTVVQLQALERAGAQVGVTSDKVRGSIERFGFQFSELKEASGDLYNRLLQIDPALAKQASEAHSLAEAWDVVSKAMKKVEGEDLIALSRSAFGRGGVGTSRLAAASADAGGINQLAAAMDKIDVITKEQAEHWDELGDSIEENMKLAKQNIQTLYAEDVLEGLDKLTNAMLELSRVAKQNKSTIDTFFDGMLDSLKRTYPTLALFLYASGAIINKLNEVGSSRGLTQTDFDKRFSPAIGSLKTPDQAAIDQAKQAQDKLNESVIRTYNNFKREMDILGDAATPTDRLKLKMLELAAAKAKDATVTEAAARALKIFKESESVAALERNVSALGSAATPVEQLTLEIAKLQLQLDKGEISATTFNRAVQSRELDMYIQKMEEGINAAGGLATATEKYALEVEKLKQKLDAGKISQDDFNRGVLAANPAFQVLQQSAETFLNSFVQGMMNGQSATEAMRASLKNLSAQLASGAIKSLLSGDFVTAGIQAVAAIGTYLFSGGDQSKKQQQRQDFLDGLKRQQEFDDRTRAAQRLSSDTLAGALQAFDQQAESQRNEEIKAGGMALHQLDQALAAERLQVIQKFKDDAAKLLEGDSSLSEIAQSFKDIQDAAKTLTDALTQAGETTDQVAGMVEKAVNKLRSSFTDDIQRQINSASNKGYLNDIADLFKQVAQMRQDAATLGLGTDLIDTLFGTSAQNIVDQANLVGDSFNDLVKMFPDLAGVVHESSKAIQDQIDAQQAFQKSIEDYLAKLRGSDLSTLSPEDKLNAAQAEFNRQLSLAQSGDQNARSTITEYSDAYVNAARDFYASGSAYKAIFDQVTLALSALAGAGTVTATPIANGPVSFSASSIASAGNDNYTYMDLATVNANGFNEVVKSINDIKSTINAATDKMISAGLIADFRTERPGKRKAASNG